ncbi:DUF4214 domain-containing protein [Pigmentiphaga aceris]|uniref:DUF4214 domain-containing protein n=1 Tax=Pigmentiphaga aceris TaxID=1940612 RepID=A0A5C0ASL8_9BURK|nr:DUF4214 domain-containing protein [Pigmentiphaga aceris]QEI05269.1 DUF4214 domain-containing protein [Pigmentiphaga aceris]
MATATTAQQNAISALYIALFNRAPDADGFKFWSDALVNGVSPISVTAAFLTSPEARSIYTDTQTQEQFVAAFYQTVFGRAADAGGLAFWTGVLNTATQDNPATAKALLVSKIIELVSTPLPTKPVDLTDAQYAQTVADRDLFGKKVVVGLDYAVTQQGNDLVVAKQLIANLMTPVIPSPPAPTPVGQTYRLTTGTDNFTGNGGDDTFDASLDSGNQTLDMADRLDGGAGRDTVRITLNTYHGSGVFTPTLKNIEVIRVTALTGADDSFNLNNSSGFTDVGFDGSTIAHTITNVGNAALSVSNQTKNAAFEGSTATALSLTMSKVGAVGSPITVDLASNLFSRGAKATTHNIVMEDAYVTFDRGVFTSDTITSLTVAATGDNKLTIVNLDAATMTNLTVTGSGSVDFTGRDLLGVSQVTAGDGGIKLISINTVPNSVTINTGAGTDTITANGASISVLNTGGGNDVVTIRNSALSATSKVNLGDGDDTLTLTHAPIAGAVVDGGAGRDTLKMGSATPNYALINAVTHFEVLAVDVASTILDVGQVTSMKEFLVANTGITQFQNVQDTMSFHIDTSSDVNEVQLQGVSPTTTADVTLNNASATTREGSLTAGGFLAVGNISLTSSGTGDNTNAIQTLYLSTAATATIKGAADLKLTLAPTAQNITIDATSFTGKLTVTGGNNADILKGGKGADTLAGGSGNDTFVIESTAVTRGFAFSPADTNTDNIDKITDFVGNDGAPGDQIRLGIGDGVFGADIRFTVATTANVTAVTVASPADFTTLAAAIETASAGVASTNTTARVYDVTVTGGNLAGRYLVLNDATDAITAADMIVSITGITGALHAQDFVFA